MQALIVEALMGLFGTAILGLAGFQTILGRRFNNNLRWNLLALSAARRDSRILAMAMRELPLQKAAAPVVAVGKPLQSCPACGLQGPEQMIKEHFLGSPTHEAGKPEVDTRDEVAPLAPARKRGDPASLAMLRSILRQLAPPRAFGLRSREREIDPLRGLTRRARILPSSLVSIASLP